MGRPATVIPKHVSQIALHPELASFRPVLCVVFPAFKFQICGRFGAQIRNFGAFLSELRILTQFRSRWVRNWFKQLQVRLFCGEHRKICLLWATHGVFSLFSPIAVLFCCFRVKIDATPEKTPHFCVSTQLFGESKLF